MPDTTNWRELYRSKLKSPDDAAALIGEGDLVSIGFFAPTVITSAFQRRASQLGRVDFRVLAPRDVALFGPEGPRGEKEIELFIGDGARPAHDSKVATYLPNTFMSGMKAFDSGRPEARMPDVLLTSCSEPNENGYVHFGAHLWTKKSYAKRVKRTIAVVDPNIAPVFGDVWMHVSEIDTLVEGAVGRIDVDAIRERVQTLAPESERAGLLEVLAAASVDQLQLVAETFHGYAAATLRAAFSGAAIDADTQAIADNVRQVIRDGDTIQVGVGQPSTLMFRAGAFDDARHLGLHTELGSPGIGRLWEKGILDNSRKTLHRGRSVAVAWTGCDAYDMKLIVNNPAFELYDPDYLLHPLTMAQNETMTSINSAIAVDLLGQIASEDRFGGHMVNGTGGQPDTHISAYLSKRGRAITVMKATALEGTISKIVARHDAGTLVTIPRYLADTIVTEFGIARLMDKNHRQRAEEMISIAHPDFRAELRKQALELVGSL